MLHLRTALLAIVFAAFGIAHAGEPSPGKEPCLKLIHNDSLSPVADTLGRYFQRAYNDIGHCVVSTPVPPKRALKLLETGAADGDWFRVEQFAEDKDHLVMLMPTPILSIEVRFFWLKDGTFTGKADDLAGRTVGYPAGVYWTEQRLAKLDVHAVALFGDADVYALLSHGRFSVFVGNSIMDAAQLKAPSGLTDQLVQATWERVPLYHAVHVSHADLLPALDKALQAALETPEGKAVLALPGIFPPPSAPSVWRIAPSPR